MHKLLARLLFPLSADDKQSIEIAQFIRSAINSVALLDLFQYYSE